MAVSYNPGPVITVVILLVYIALGFKVADWIEERTESEVLSIFALVAYFLLAPAFIMGFTSP